MQREVWESRHCSNCGSIVAALVREDDIDEEGQPRHAIFWDRLPHGNKECAKMTALVMETWPRLFEMEALKPHGTHPR
jgi:hypothetical protein